MTGATTNRLAAPARLHIRQTAAEHHYDGDGGYGFFRHAHPFPSPPMSPSARSVSPRSPRQLDFEAIDDDTDAISDDVDTQKPLRQRFALFILCLLNCFMVFPNSLIGPLVPKLARESGVSMTSTGVILAMFSIAMFVTGPIITASTKGVPPKLTTIAGGVLLTVCTIAFAFVNHFRGWQFIVISAAIRFIQGVGGSAYSCGSSLLILKLFPNHIAVTSGMLEVSASTGYLIGPALGNILYKRGGFSMPFLGIGVATFLSIIPVSLMRLTSNDDHESNGEDDAEVEIVSPLDIIRCSNVITILILNTLGMAVLGLQELAINPIFSGIGATVDQVAFAFVMNSIVYGLFSGVFGWINMKRPNWAAVVLFIGSLVMGLGLVGFAGTMASLIPENLPMKCISLAVMMVGFAMSQNPVLPILVTQTQHLGPGYEHALSGVLVSSVGFGEIVGPIVAGLLFDTIGLPLGAGIMSISICTLAAWVYWRLDITSRFVNGDKNEEEEEDDDDVTTGSGNMAGLRQPLLVSVTSTTSTEFGF